MKRSYTRLSTGHRSKAVAVFVDSTGILNSQAAITALEDEGGLCGVVTVDLKVVLELRDSALAIRQAIRLIARIEPLSFCAFDGKFE